MTLGLISAIVIPQSIAGVLGPPGPSSEPPQTGSIFRWHKAEIANITLTGSFVEQWDDISGHNNHLTQSVASDQPLWVTSTSSFNGQSAVAFDGATDFMVGLNPALTGSGITIGLTYRKNREGASDAIIAMVKPGVSDFTETDIFNIQMGAGFESASVDKIEFSPEGDSGDVKFDNLPIGRSHFQVFRIDEAAGVVKIWNTGSVDTHVSESKFTTFDIQKCMIGARDPVGNETIIQHAINDYFEIIVYQTALSDETIGELNNYMSHSLADTLS